MDLNNVCVCVVKKSTNLCVSIFLSVHGFQIHCLMRSLHNSKVKKSLFKDPYSPPSIYVTPKY